MQKIVGLIGLGRGPVLVVPRGKATAVVAGMETGVVRIYSGDGGQYELEKSGELLLGHDVGQVQFEYCNGECQPICSVRID